MMIISSREFRDQQKRYFDQVDQNEQVIVQRGKDKTYVIVPLNDVDRLSVNDSDWEETVSRFEPITFKAKSLFLESGNIATSLGYIRRGLMQSFFTMTTPMTLLPMKDCWI